MQPDHQCLQIFTPTAPRYLSPLGVVSSRVDVVYGYILLNTTSGLHKHAEKLIMWGKCSCMCMKDFRGKNKRILVYAKHGMYNIVAWRCMLITRVN